MTLEDELSRIESEIAGKTTEKATLSSGRLGHNPAKFIVQQGNNNQVVKLPGRKVKLLRKQLGLTQSQLAEKADLAPATIRAVELEQRLTRVKTAVRIAKALEVRSPTELHPALPLFLDEPGTDERGLVATPGSVTEDPLGLNDPATSIVTRANGHHVVLLGGRRVELLRKRAGLTREELGTKSGLTEKAVEMVEGEQRLLRVDTALILAQVLDADPAKLHPALSIFLLPVFWSEPPFH